MGALSKRAFPLGKPNWPGTLEPKRERSNLGANFETSWSRRYPVRLLRAIVLDNVLRPAAKALASPEIIGTDRLEGLAAPVIFASNHASHLDTPLVLSMLPERFRHRCVVAAGADYFFDKRWKAYLWSGLLALIPIERHRVNRRSGEVAAELLAKGWNVLIFPEGGRSPDGLGQDFRGGMAQLSIKLGRPIIPVFVEGTYEIFGKNSKSIRPGKTRIVFGSPIYPGDANVRTLVAKVERAVAALALEVHRDWWTSLQSDAKTEVPSLNPPNRGSWIADWQRTAELPKRSVPRRWPRYFGSSSNS